jgi:pyoverdine/dityrosine biosynthesis protein Dit1
MVEKYDVKINLTQDISLNVKINSVMNHEEFLGFLQQVEGLFKPFVKQQMNIGMISEPKEKISHKKNGGRDSVGIGQDSIKKYASKVISLMKKENITATEAFRQLIGFIPTGGEYAFMRQCGISIGGKNSKEVKVKKRKPRTLTPEFSHFMSERMKTINAKTKEIAAEFPKKRKKIIKSLMPFLIM